MIRFLRRPLLFVVASLCLTISSGRAADPRAKASEVRALVAEHFDSAGPGAAILVSRNGAPVHLSGFGLADIKSKSPITPDSMFDLASVSKHVTGAANLRFIEQGKLDPDAPLKDVLPDFAVPEKGRPVTVADLLHHVSGLADYTGDEWDGSDKEFADLTPETHLAWLNGTTARRKPGVKFEYNNTEYVLLALVVERLSHQTFNEYVREQLFLPAGMRQTFVRDGTMDLPGTTVKGYKVDDGGRVHRASSPTVITGDGSVYTSVRELALWDAALRSDTVIAHKSLQQAWTGGRLDSGKPVRDEDGNGYGYGWFTDPDKPLVFHSGSWDGTSTFLIMGRNNGLTVAVLSNDENADTESLARAIYELFDDDGSRDADSNTPELPSPQSRKFW